MLGGTGTFTVTGQANAFIETQVITADVATFTLTGEDAILDPTISIAPQAGTFTLTGFAAGIANTIDVNVPNAFVLTGQDATLSAGRARRFEYAGVANAAELSQDQPNDAILVQEINEAA